MSRKKGIAPAAVRFFSGRLTTIPGAGTEDGLRAFFALLTQRLEFIYAQLEGENAFNIFKSLNSTGVPLGQSDLIRNFVFMQVPVEDQDDFDETLWKPTERRFEDDQGNLDTDAFSAFVRDYLMRRGEYILTGKTFDTFQRHYAATEFDPKHVAAELKQASEWHEILRGQRPDPNSEVEGALDSLRQLDSSTTFSLLLNLYQRRHRCRLNDADLAEALRLLAGFILRRLICGENSRGYGKMFVQAITALGDDPIENLRRFLEARGFPDAPRFVEAFARFNLYASRYRKVVLEALERANEHKEPVMLTDAQVEHIMPQTLSAAWRSDLGPDSDRIHSTWLHTPGNLTLTGYNAELANKPFNTKRQEYRGSNIGMTRQLADHASWGEAEIQQRGQAMAEVASRIWAGPAEPVQQVDEETKTAPSRFEVRLRYWNGFRDHVQATGSPLKVGKPKPYYSLLCDRLASRISLYAFLILKSERIAVSAYFEGEEQRRDFRALGEHRDAIEAEIGAKLVWNHDPDKKGCEIVLRNLVDPTDEALWPSYYDWMQRSLETFRRVLAPRITKLQEKDETALTPRRTVALKAHETRRFQEEYWTALRDSLLQSQSVVKPRKPLPQHWTNIAIGRSGFELSATVLKSRKEIAVYLILSGPLANQHFHLLLKDRAAIEEELGMELEWKELPGKKESHVVIVRSNVDPSRREDWPEQHAWIQEKLEAFHKVFGPKIKELDAGTDISEPTAP